MNRLDRAREVHRLLDQGLNGVQIADTLGLSRSYAYALIHDPDGSGDKARKASYGQPCIDCGQLTDGSNGRSGAALRCQTCAATYQRDNRRWTHETVVDAIRRWNDLHGRPPGAHEWLGPTGGDYPNTSVVQREFGKWADAIEAAGFPRPEGTGTRPGTLTDADYRRTAQLVEEHGRRKTAELLGITVSGVHMRLKRLRRDYVPGYTVQTAIARDIEKQRNQVKRLERELAERKEYIAALEKAQEAIPATGNGKRG